MHISKIPFVRLVLLFVFIALMAETRAFSQDGWLVLNDGDYEGLKVIKSEEFKAEQLYNYIDGGADLFFEYGFKSVTIQDLDINGNSFYVEYFSMGDAESAFGITALYRQSIFDFSTENKVYFNQTVEQTQFFLKNYYVRVVNNTDFDGGKRVCGELMQVICNKNPAKKFELPLKIKIDKDILSTWDVKMTHGALGLQNALPNEPNYYSYLQSMTFYFLALSDNDETEIRIFKLTEDSQLTDLLEQLQISRDELVFKNYVMTQEGGYFTCKKINDKKTLFLVRSKDDARSKSILDLLE